MYKPYDRNKLLISLHLPKTAGTTLQSVLRVWFGDRLHDHYPGRPPVTKTRKKRDACVHGHFSRRSNSSIRDYYPDADQVITVMRDPFDRLVSEWRFRNMLRMHGEREAELGDNPTFDTWFARRTAELEQEPMTRIMMHMPSDLTPDTVSTAFDQDFVAVGLTEDFSTTLRLFARVLDKPLPTEERINVGNFGDAKDYESYRARHEVIFHSDHELYAAAQRAFNELKRQYQVD